MPQAKGSTIGKVILALDPRGFQVYALEGASSTNERPFMAPYWECLPPRGKLAFLDTSWYQEVLNSGEHPWDGQKERRAAGQHPTPLSGN